MIEKRLIIFSTFGVSNLKMFPMENLEFILLMEVHVKPIKTRML